MKCLTPSDRDCEEETTSHDDERYDVPREGARYGGEERGGSASTTDPIYERQRIDGERGVQPPEQPKRSATQRGLERSRGGSTTRRA